MKKIFFYLSALLLPSIFMTSCDTNGNNYESTTNLFLLLQMPDSIDLYVNVDSSKVESGEVYSHSLAIAASQALDSAFLLSHYCQGRDFVGGITISNMNDVKTASAENYSSILGHGCLITTAADKYNQTSFVADLNKEATIKFKGLAFSPEHIYVSNAAYTYLVMKNGDKNTGVSPFGIDDYLKLTIFALDAKGAKTGEYVDTYLAKNGTIVDAWVKVSLTSLSDCYGLQFELSTADGVKNSDMAIPARFCLDFLYVSKYYYYAY